MKKDDYSKDYGYILPNLEFSKIQLEISKKEFDYLTNVFSSIKNNQILYIENKDSIILNIKEKRIYLKTIDKNQKYKSSTRLDTESIQKTTSIKSMA